MISFLFELFWNYNGNSWQLWYESHSLYSIFWTEILGQRRSHQLPSNMRWSSEMAFALFLGRRRDVLVQLHPGFGSKQPGRQKSVSVWFIMLGQKEVCEIMWRIILQWLWYNWTAKYFTFKAILTKILVLTNFYVPLFTQVRPEKAECRNNNCYFHLF